jgi:hypothetical protein
MKPVQLFFARIISRLLLPLAAAGMFAAGSARAGLTVDVHLYHDSIGYYFYPYLSANTNLPNFPTGIYQIASWQIPTNGSRLVYQATNNTISECYDNDCGGGNYYYNFDAYLYAITNRPWSITVTNNTSTNIYYFKVKVTGLTSNALGAPVLAIYPTNGAINVPNQPLFQWTGPTTNWTGTLSFTDYSVDTNGNYTFVTAQGLTPATTSLTPTTVLPNGTNTFTIDYQSNITALVTASQPTNSAGQPISGWVSSATFESDFAYSPFFTVGQTSAPDDYDPFLVARYNFEVTNNATFDSSGNNLYSDCSSSSGPESDTFSTNAAVGNYSRQFFGQSSYCFTQNDPAYQVFSNALAGNFSVTAWVSTSNSVSGDYANAYFGAPIFFAGADYNNHCTIPLSITGSKAAFTINSTDGPGTVTLQSTTSVNDGTYHFLAVTRQQATGLMCVYVDGNLEASGYGITNPVVTQGYISLAGGYYQYAGLLDDVRIYSTNLSAADVASIQNGGSVPTLAGAVGATNLSLTTSGDAGWFVETTNTYNGAPAAAQSGVINNNQSSTLSTTVTGPGTLTFYWSSLDNDPNQDMDYEFYIDDPDSGDIADLYGGGNAWQSIEDMNGGSPIVIPAGQHTLNWTVYADGDADPSQAGFLDKVIFASPDTSPVSANITFNIYREQDPNFGDIYILFPYLNSVTPAPVGTTTNTVQSPNGYFNGHYDPSGPGEGSAILFSLGSLLNECTNGLWSLYINYGLQNQRQFQFSVSISGLTTNLLSAVKLIAPTNGATGFQSTASIQWTGPTNYSSLSISKQNADGSAYIGTNLPVNATSWTPGLIAGTNNCNISYASNNFPNISFSVPYDSADSQTASNLVTQVNLNSTANANFVVVAGASHVTLLSPQTGGGNFQFSFQSQTGFTNSVQYRTNLVVGNWLTWTNIPGDGTLKIVPVPLSLFSPSKSGFIRVGTK